MQEVFNYPRDFRPQDLGDIDLQGIYPILAASCIMLTPILDWSIEMRKNARAIAVLWGSLIFAAVIPTFVHTYDGVVPYFNMNQIATCYQDAAQDCTRKHVISGPLFNTVSADFYNRLVFQMGMISIYG